MPSRRQKPSNRHGIHSIYGDPLIKHRVADLDIGLWCE